MLLLAAVAAALALGQAQGTAPYVAGADGTVPPIVTAEAALDAAPDPLRIVPAGDIVVGATIRADGTITDVIVVAAADAGLGARAAETLRSWQFEPATRAGTPIDVRARFTFPIPAGGSRAVHAHSLSVAFTPGPDTLAPRLLQEVAPTYPGAARDAGITGTVHLSAVILPDGTPTAITVIEGVEPTLDQAATDALHKWRFAPGQRNTVGVPVLVYVEIDFRKRP